MIKRIVIAYKPDGFIHTGGLRRVAIEVVHHFQNIYPKLVIATITNSSHGRLPNTEAFSSLRSGDQLLVVGCDVIWGYLTILYARIKGLPVAWMPCFHDPRSAIHRRKAYLAQLAIRAIQALGVNVYVLTPHEAELLDSCRGKCRLSSHALPHSLRLQLQHTQSGHKAIRNPSISLKTLSRPIDLLFLGRPTAQKGWPVFEAVATQSKLRCEAVVPFTPPSHQPGDITLHIHPSDLEVTELLAQTKLVVIPANYESFGIAQMEAVLAGCVVPILGHWPLWEDFDQLHWSKKSIAELANLCQQLCSQEGLRRKFHQHQLTYLRQHPILKTPVLPGLP